MALIPKVRVSQPNKKSKIDLSCDSSGTLNFGQIVPTFARDMVPNEKFVVDTSNIVYMDALPCPTFGRMSLRHYHCFVPYCDIFAPFNSFIANQKYMFSDNGIAIPTMAKTDLHLLFQFVLMNFCDVSMSVTNDITVLASDSVVANLFATDHTFSNGDKLSDFGKGGLVALAVGSSVSPVDPMGVGAFIFSDGSYFNGSISSMIGMTSAQITAGKKASPAQVPVTYENADFVYTFSSSSGQHYFFCRLKPRGRRLVAILRGLGYQPSPYYAVNTYCNPLRILAFYKAWFYLFAPKRELNFSATSASRVIQRFYMQYYSNLLCFDGTPVALTPWALFLVDLSSLSYYLPIDYFSMSQNNAFAGYGTNGSQTLPVASFSLGTPSAVTVDQGSTLEQDSISNVNSALATKIAMRLVTYSGKNTVIGRSISDYLRVHFGINVDTHHEDSVDFVGSDRLPINISTIMSNSETLNSQNEVTMKLGEYAGRGYVNGGGNKHSYSARDYGVFITMSVIVPESGYSQGTLRENMNQSRYDYFHPEFDALGYQPLLQSEIKADYPIAGKSYSPSFNSTFGYVPRYSELKVGYDVVNGDLALRSRRASMAPYTFTRQFPDADVVVDATGKHYVAPAYRVTQVHDNFRILDPSDQLGIYNRLFSYTGIDADHFVYHCHFGVTSFSPKKSLSESFETVRSDEDGMTNQTIQ